MEFISFYIEDTEGIVFEIVTLSPVMMRTQLAPRILLETTDWLAAALVPVRRRNDCRS